VPASLVAQGSTLLFGEVHGVRELPAFFGEAVCTTAASGLQVEVGLEIPRTDQAGVDAFLQSQGAPSDVESLIASSFWSRDFQDGRSSQARVDLLERLRVLIAQGLPLHVFLFDVDVASEQAQREKAMADSIAAQARLHSQALTMVLVGEVHAWKTKGAPWDADFVPMGLQLAESGLEVHSLGRSTPAGTAWVCTGVSAADCTERDTKAFGGWSSAHSGIELLSEPSARGYDGMYATPTLTASPPAKPGA
jgi:hypothetical protein